MQHDMFRLTKDKQKAFNYFLFSYLTTTFKFQIDSKFMCIILLLKLNISILYI